METERQTRRAGTTGKGIWRGNIQVKSVYCWWWLAGITVAVLAIWIGSAGYEAVHRGMRSASQRLPISITPWIARTIKRETCESPFHKTRETQRVIKTVSGSGRTITTKSHSSGNGASSIRKAMDDVKPCSLGREYVRQGKSETTAVVIFLHGLGDTGEGWSMAGFEKALPHCKFIYPR